MDKDIYSENYSGCRYVSINDLRFHYLDFGGAGETLLFLAGLGDTAYSFSTLAPKFTSNFRVIALTRRGFGKSDMPQDICNVNRLVEDVISFLDVLQIPCVSLVGHSLAGNEITLLASLYPEKVKKIIYLDAAYNRDVDLREISKNDPINMLAANKMPADAFLSLETYLFHYKLRHPNLYRIWSPTLEKLCLERIYIHNDGTIEEINQKKIKSQIKKSIEECYFSYGNIKAPILSVYSLQEEHPYLPLGSSQELRSLANKYNKDVWVPYTQKNIKKLMRENKSASIVELWGADHYCHLSNEEDIYNYAREFLED